MCPKLHIVALQKTILFKVHKCLQVPTAAILLSASEGDLIVTPAVAGSSFQPTPRSFAKDGTHPSSSTTSHIPNRAES
jgi:hypothetical protein